MLLKNVQNIPSYTQIYTQQVAPETDLINALEKYSRLETLLSVAQMEAIGDKVYAPNKWTVASILQHLIDTERIFAYRALRIARNDPTELPGFDENLYASHAKQRSIKELVDEFALVRQSSIVLFKSLNDDELSRTAVCSGLVFSAAALGFAMVGHPIHHFRVIEEKYLPLRG